MAELIIKSAAETQWDCVSFGEVMLRFDPGFGRVRNARSFQVWEGGGEYNVARAMRKCWGKRAAVVTALPRNDLGWLVEDFIMQGGVDMSYVIWRDFDGLGRNTRVGLNFTEKGFGIRPALGCSDRGHSAASQIRPGEVNWEKLFGEDGVRWFQTGGIFAALASNTAEAVLEAVQVAKKHGTVVAYDLNFRASLWKSQGGKDGAQRINREFPNFKVAATTLRNAKTATINDWSAIVWYDGQIYESMKRDNLEIYDRVGGGDGFASGLAYGFLEGKGPQAAVEYGAAHGALASTTPGDTSMATRKEVEKQIKGGGARVVR